VSRRLYRSETVKHVQAGKLCSSCYVGHGHLGGGCRSASEMRHHTAVNAEQCGTTGIVHHTALYHYYKAQNIDTCSNNIDNVICRSVVDSSAFFRLFYNFENCYVNTLKQQSTIS